jgi:hypothetical protein
MLEAMQQTVDLMEKYLQQMAEDGDASGSEQMMIEKLDPSLQPEHVREMLLVMKADVNPQDTEKSFSDGKLGRWLGWAQAAVVAMGAGTLEDMKTINKRCAD